MTHGLLYDLGLMFIGLIPGLSIGFVLGSGGL